MEQKTVGHDESPEPSEEAVGNNAAEAQKNPQGGSFAEKFSRMVEEPARIYGLALAGAGFNILFLTCVSVLAFTIWGNDGSTSGMPQFDPWTWNVFFAIVYPTVVACRTTFTIASNGPVVAPGEEIFQCESVRACAPQSSQTLTVQYYTKNPPSASRLYREIRTALLRRTAGLRIAFVGYNLSSATPRRSQR